MWDKRLRMLNVLYLSSGAGCTDSRSLPSKMCSLKARLELASSTVLRKRKNEILSQDGTRNG